MKRTIFFVSDGTGITAETIGHSLLTQFDGVDFKQVRIPFVDDEEKARGARDRIRQAGEDDAAKPLVINTLVEPRLTEIIAESGALVLDLFDTFVQKIETELGIRRNPRVGRAHGLVDYQEYESRMEATNYALKHDDGADLNFESAEVILVGVSRSGKTPTCLYLALHYGVKAGNYPLTPEDLEDSELPRRLRPYRHKLFGLTIDPVRLQQIRQIRRPNSRYSSLRQCQQEVAEAEEMFRRHRIPNLSSTHTSVEEIASKVLVALNLERELF